MTLLATCSRHLSSGLTALTPGPTGRGIRLCVDPTVWPSLRLSRLAARSQQPSADDDGMWRR